MERDVYVTAPIFNVSTIGILWQYFVDGVFDDYTFVLVTPSAGDGFYEIKTAIQNGINAYNTLNEYTVDLYSWWVPEVSDGSQDGLLSADDKTKLDGLTAPVKNLFTALVAGGSGDVIFYTDTNGDGTGTALYPTLTDDNIMLAIDSQLNQYAFQTVTVAIDFKSVTVNVQLLTSGTYGDAPNGVKVKMIVGN